MTQAFNLSQFANKVNTSGQADLTTGVTGTLPVANGGTGAASLTGNSVAITNAGGTALSTVAAGASGNVLTSNGTTWVSQAVSGGGQAKVEWFNTPGTFTTPSSTTWLKITCIGGGGGSIPGQPAGSGLGGLAIGYCPVSASTPYTVTVGAGGNPSATGGTSSVGSLISATGGSSPASPGTGTVTTGTALIRSNMDQVAAGVYSYIAQGSKSRAIAPGGQPGTPYTIPGGYMAGAAGGYLPSQPNPTTGGVGGLIVIEYVG